MSLFRLVRPTAHRAWIGAAAACRQQRIMKLHNSADTRQPNETIDAFLARLPPSTRTLPNPLPPWYWISNPHRDEGALGDVESFTREGLALLQEALRQMIVDPGNGYLRGVRRILWETQIQKAASKWGVVSGKVRFVAHRRWMIRDAEVLGLGVKWMLFPGEKEVNKVWRTVCDGVDTNRLGTGAKVSTERTRDDRWLICVYTKDFTDQEDVKRVLVELVKMGLVRRGGERGAVYKCDAYTHLGISWGNRLGLKASNYRSWEMMDR